MKWYDRTVTLFGEEMDIPSLVFFFVAGLILVAFGTGFVWILLYHPAWLGVVAFFLVVGGLMLAISWLRS